VTLKLCLAISKTAVRADPVFAATVTTTDPVPEPVLGLTLIQFGAPLTFQSQWDRDVTATVMDPPLAATFSKLAGAIAYVHGAAACETENVWVPIFGLALRASDVFAWTVRVTVPLPVPPAGEAEIHADKPVTVHVQPTAVETATSIELPLEGALKLDGFMLNEHAS
jgi:hypothetical protein